MITVFSNKKRQYDIAQSSSIFYIFEQLIETRQTLQPKKLTYKLSRILILLCFPLLLAGQNTYKSFPDSLRSTIRLQTFLLINSESLSSGIFNEINDRIPLAFLIDSGFTPDQMPLLNKLSIKQKQIPIIIKKQVPISGNGLSGFVHVDLEEIDAFPLNKQEDIDSMDFSRFSNNELLLVKLKNSTPISMETVIKLWEQTGKQPNFIQVEGTNREAALELIYSLNNQKSIFGVVKSEEKLLENVSWKEFPTRKTNGYFCFPISSDKSMQISLTPYKAGYQFSPDIIMDGSSNKDHLKEFKALKLNADFKLTSYYRFNSKIENLKNDNAEILNYGVDFKNDDSHGPVAYFAKGTYIDGGLQSKSVLKSNFSITAWIKPTEINQNNSIFGKGKIFVLKIQNGVLTYTMQGIKDYSAKKAMIPVNKWTFIGLVHSANENQMRYYINGQLVDQFQLINKYEESDYSLLIGSNLWEEYFVGYMGEIKIWERELNDEEILNQYKTPSNTTNKSLKIELFAGFLILCTLIVFFVIFLRKKTKKAIQKKKPTTEKKEIDTTEKILCFGGLQVINTKGIDVSKKFSPKLKQLFVLIFLNSINGQKGISSVKLTSVIWPGLSASSAKNTRGTNIQNLKAALESCSNIKLVFKDKLWLLEMNESCYDEYTQAISKLYTLKETSSTEAVIEDLPALISILKKGTLFPNMKESWIDPFISGMSDQIIELGVSLFLRLDDEKHNSLLFELAEVISSVDPLNEPALQKKLSLLTKQGKLGLAKTVYDNFTKLYLELYQENYSVDFKTFTHHYSEKN